MKAKQSNLLKELKKIPMIKIRKSTKKDITESIKIAKSLKEWFNKEGIKNMKTDFNLNNVIVAIEKSKVIGFICYSSYCGKMLLMWMAVRRDYQNKRIGGSLLKWLEKEARKLGLYSIEVETLPDEDHYEPYKRTREFYSERPKFSTKLLVLSNIATDNLVNYLSQLLYYKNGFKRIAYKKARFKGRDDQIVLEKNLKWQN